MPGGERVAGLECSCPLTLANSEETNIRQYICHTYGSKYSLET